MPFGVRNAPAKFQHLVNCILSGMSRCEAYLDDIVLYSSSWSEHLNQIKYLCFRLAEANLTINFAKSEFGKATVTYLGKVVGNGCVKPISAKVEAICGFPIPTNRHELRRFLGMMGYYRSFCQNFASVVLPLTNLSPKIVFHWSEVCQQAFANCKALLASYWLVFLSWPPRILRKSFSLAIVASAYGAGTVLLKEDSNGIEHPVSYFSKKFNRHQKVYPTVYSKKPFPLCWLYTILKYIWVLLPQLLFIQIITLSFFLNRMINQNQQLMQWSLGRIT